MPRRRSGKDRPTEVGPKNVLQTNKRYSSQPSAVPAKPYISGDISNLKPIFDDNKLEPGSSRGQSLNQSTAALHDELDSFRQRWRRELEIKKPEEKKELVIDQQSISGQQDDSKENKYQDKQPGTSSSSSKRPENPKEVYALAKKLFMMGVNLEQDELHHESIRYYKQAMHLYPDIEKQIFREQCEASLKTAAENKTSSSSKVDVDSKPSSGEDELPIFDRIKTAFFSDRTDGRFSYCRAAHKTKSGSKHMGNLPHDLILQIFRYVIGKELDLASLESLGLVCRGFYVLSRDPSLWRSICYATWCEKELQKLTQTNNSEPLDWREIYLTRPRVNVDGVYMSRTRYIRQGDVGFQDITYRPFHIVRYYRYLRFFPDDRVLILTTNEEPDKIIPIFRHALHSKHFSSELSIMEGTYELVDTNELVITAKKDFTLELEQTQQKTYNQRRQARFHWSRQTPLWQKFDMRFKLKTIDHSARDGRSFKNNVLKWLEYSIVSQTELGQELTEFDLSSDTFPVMSFSRVKKFNLRLSEPLPSH